MLMNLEFEDGALGREAVVERASLTKHIPYVVDMLRWVPDSLTTLSMAKASSTTTAANPRCASPHARLKC